RVAGKGAYFIGVRRQVSLRIENRWFDWPVVIPIHYGDEQTRALEWAKAQEAMSLPEGCHVSRDVETNLLGNILRHFLPCLADEGVYLFPKRHSPLLGPPPAASVPGSPAGGTAGAS